MKKKKLIAPIIAASIVLSASFAGCSLVSSNNNADMEQVIAEVNISEADGLSAAETAIINNFKSAVGTTAVKKRELVAYYLNVGYSYVQSGYSYNQVFNMLVDGLVENAVLTQYAVMYLLNEKVSELNSTPQTILEEYNGKSEAGKLEYLLSEDDIKVAKYNLYSSINSAIDSYESNLLDEESSSSGAENRSTPGGVDAETEDYYPKAPAGLSNFKEGDLYYNVYTGYAGYQLKDSGDYEDKALEGSTKSTRIKAYNSFMSSLISNGLVDPETENLRDIVNGVDYINEEYISQLESRVIDKYYHDYEDEQEERLTDGGTYDYLNAVYNDLLAVQSSDNKTASAFTTAIGNMSDSSFILYAPDTEDGGTYGFVYNILLPFDPIQSAKLTSYQSMYADDDTDGYKAAYYSMRRDLMSQIVTTDQRSAWFNGSTDYSFDANENDFEGYYNAGNADRHYLFFENNLTDNDRYEPLEKYAGKYSYNGKVYEMKDGGYILVPQKLTIDNMLDEFVAYVNYVLDDNGAASYEKNPAYDTDFSTDAFWTEETRNKSKVADREIDYSNFIYAKGSVNFNGLDVKEYKNNLLDKTTAQYKALSAVNELQYAYTTDTSVLSQYLGYSVSLGDTTGYIKEFETAAHEAIARGVGSFNVCAGDYGWHLIYVTYTFNNKGEAEYTPDWKNNVKVEGTFENLFFEWVKSNDISQISTSRRTQIITQFNKDNTVTKYQSRYQDLLDLS